MYVPTLLEMIIELQKHCIKIKHDNEMYVFGFLFPFNSTLWAACVVQRLGNGLPRDGPGFD